MPIPAGPLTLQAMQDQLEAANEECHSLRQQVAQLKASIERMQSLAEGSRPGRRHTTGPSHGFSMARVRQLVRSYSDSQHEGWLGSAPSYLCTDLGITYDDACALLLDLEAQGVIRRNNHGNTYHLPDGRVCPTRFDVVHEER